MSFDTPTPGYNASDPTATYLNVSCLDLLLIEMVPLAERMARRAEEAVSSAASGTTAAEASEGAATAGGQGPERGRQRASTIGTIGGSEAGAGTGDQSIFGEDVRDAVCARLDAWGYRVGQGLSER